MQFIQRHPESLIAVISMALFLLRQAGFRVQQPSIFLPMCGGEFIKLVFPASKPVHALYVRGTEQKETALPHDVAVGQNRFGIPFWG